MIHREVPKLVEKGKGYSVVEVNGERLTFKELGLAELEGRLSPAEMEKIYQERRAKRR